MTACHISLHMEINSDSRNWSSYVFRSNFRSVRAGPEKSILARKLENIFQGPDFVQNRAKFLHLMDIFTILAELLFNERQNLDQISVFCEVDARRFSHEVWSKPGKIILEKWSPCSGHYRIIVPDRATIKEYIRDGSLTNEKACYIWDMH